MRRLLVVAVVRERVVALRHLHLVRVVDQVARRGDNVARIVGWHFEIFDGIDIGFSGKIDNEYLIKRSLTD